MKESEIRPRELLERYLSLSGEDAQRFFSNGYRENVECVACGSDLAAVEFTKQGFDYSRCRSCASLFVSPRPSAEQFHHFYQASPSSEYWAKEFFPVVAEARREKIFRPRVHELLKLCEAKNLQIRQIVDVGAGYGIFLEEWRERVPEAELIAVEPSPELASVCRSKGLTVHESVLEEVDASNIQADLAVCFEVLEHVHNPYEFLTKMVRLVRPGGYLLISTLSIDGFDLQLLGAQSDQISPPHHINFLSVDGMRLLFRRLGMTDISVTTPGKLDVEIVRNAFNRKGYSAELPNFIKKIVFNDELANKFQAFLASNCLSSHAWVFAQKGI